MGARVSIVVPHYNDLAGLDACLRALAAQTRAPDEIIVADNNSPQGEAAVAAAVAGRAKLVVVAEKGAGPARNGGAAAASGDVLAFTDSDCVPEPQWLERLVAGLDGADFVGGAMTVLVDDEDAITPTEAFERVFAFDNATYVLKKDFTVTANLACPRRVFDAVGGFRVGVSEDLDWCLRAKAAGFRIGYAADAVVGHPARRTWDQLQGKWRRLSAESFALTVTTGPERTRWLIRTLALPASAVAHTPKVLRSAALPRFGDRLKALGVLYRLRLWRMGDGLRLLKA